MYKKGNSSMKKICIFMITLAILIVGINAFGEVITTRKTNRPQAPQTTQPANNRLKTTIPRRSQNRLSDSIINCRPYSENLDTNLGGVNFNFKVRIEGWVNNKCVMNFVANSTGINSMFSSLYGVDPSQATVMTFEPKVRCEFTKAQLQNVGDSILQEEERNNGARNNMLKSPADIDMSSFYNMSESDQKLLDLVLNDRACRILNTTDSNGMFDAFFGY